MRRAWLAVCLVTWPAAAAEPPPPPDAEFLEFLAEFGTEDEQFAQYLESRKGEKELQRAEQEDSKDDSHD
jgi:hypothetical protein